MGRNGADMGVIWELYGHDMESGKSVANWWQRQEKNGQEINKKNGAMLAHHSETCYFKNSIWQMNKT
jgi:hypothetical protein